MAGDYWERFAAWASGPLEPSERALRRAEDAVIDTMGCILAGLATPAAAAAATVAAPGAEGRAFHWATAAHALDFDDFDLPSVAHPSAVLVPVVLALGAERGATGAACLEAYLVGLEAMDRMGAAVNPGHYEAGWHATATLGTLGAAAAAGRLIGLGAERLHTALALAAGWAVGMKVQFGTAAKPLNAGLAARNGVATAALAEAGATAAPEALGAAGFLGLFGGGAAAPVAAPGRPLAIEEHGLVVKRFPCCGYLQRILAMCLEIRAEPAFDPGRIVAVTLTAPPRNAAVIDKGLPESPDAARFSAIYCAAVALVQGQVRLADFTETAIRRADIRALAERISLVPDSRAQGPHDLAAEDPDRVVIELASGRTITRETGRLPGGPADPLSRAALFAKLEDCVEAGGAMAAPALVDLKMALRGLSGRSDVAGVTRYLGGI